jgi:hypothetical protein
MTVIDAKQSGPTGTRIICRGMPEICGSLPRPHRLVLGFAAKCAFVCHKEELAVESPVTMNASIDMDDDSIPMGASPDAASFDSRR